MIEIGLSITIGVLGLIPLIIVLWMRWRKSELQRTGIQVTAVVEDVVEQRGYRGSLTYRAIVQYYAAGWGTQRGSFIFAYSRKRPLYTRMQSVEIFYDKNKPTRFTPKDGNKFIVPLILTGFMATAFLVLAYFLLDFLLHPGGS